MLAAAERASARPPSSTWTTRTGLPGTASAADRRASARAASFAAPSPTAGMAVTTTASVASSASARARAARKSSADAAVVRSCGCCGRSPSARQRSYVRTPSDSELPRIATRGPCGSGWRASSSPVSTSSVMVSTRITPACRSSAETGACGSRVARTACPCGAPPCTTTSGLTAAVRRASRVNLRGLPIVSRYIRATSVSGSSYQYCRTSLPETSARLPADTKVDTPVTPVTPPPRRCSRDSSAMPMAPDCANRPMRPGRGISGAREALRRTSGEVLTIPKAFGPMIRMPYARACRTRARWRSRPSGPLSAYPAEMTTRPCTPCSPHSVTTSGTCSAGTATTARSTGPSMSRTERWAGTPSIHSRSSPKARLTAYSRPVNPAVRRWSRMLRPTPPGTRPTPTTATEPGTSSRRTDRASARCSRARCTARERSVGSMSNSRRTTPSSKLRFCVYPASVNTLIILVLAGSTSAVKRRMPRSRATAAMCSRRAEATPRPWWASCTRKATSASSDGPDAGMPWAPTRS